MGIKTDASKKAWGAANKGNLKWGCIYSRREWSTHKHPGIESQKAGIEIHFESEVNSCKNKQYDSSVIFGKERGTKC